jgi:hypothetical protein
VEVAYLVRFVESYLVYSEMFIPKITAGIFEEVIRVPILVLSIKHKLSLDAIR